MARKLLVADDSLTIQKVIRLALSNEGYEIQAVSDGKEAMEQIALFRPDIVLIDASLPKKNAYECKQEYNSLTDKRPCRFVLMASAFDTLDETVIQDLHFEGRLIKPFDPAHLRQILADAMRHGATKYVAEFLKLGALIFPIGDDSPPRKLLATSNKQRC